MNIQTVCVAHVLTRVVIYLCTNKMYYIFNHHHHQKLGTVNIKAIYISSNMSSL